MDERPEGPENEGEGGEEEKEAEDEHGVDWGGDIHRRRRVTWALF